MIVYLDSHATTNAVMWQGVKCDGTPRRKGFKYKTLMRAERLPPHTIPANASSSTEVSVPVEDVDEMQDIVALP